MDTALFSDINWLAVLVAAAAYFALGAIWYSFLFRDAWIKNTRIDMSDPNVKTGVGGIMVTSFILTFITALGLALIIGRIGPGGWMTGLKVGLIAGLCFSVAAISNSYLYEKRPAA